MTIVHFLWSSQFEGTLSLSGRKCNRPAAALPHNGDRLTTPFLHFPLSLSTPTMEEFSLE